ncbi:unnamed protein product [Urochloa humidicola]
MSAHFTGNVSLTIGCCNTTVVCKLQFTDNSSFLCCRMFRIGAWVVPGNFEGGRVQKLITVAFRVREQPHGPLDREYLFHRRLESNHINIVQDFVRMLMVKPNKLLEILGVGDTMFEAMWEAVMKHVMTCVPDDRLCVQRTSRQHLCGLSLQTSEVRVRRRRVSLEQLSTAQTEYTQNLILEAYENRDSLQKVDPTYKERLPETLPTERVAWELVFQTPPCLPIFKGRKIEGEAGKPLEIILVDPDSGLRATIHQVLVVLIADFPPDDV